jgi:hypothetical protein
MDVESSDHLPVSKYVMDAEAQRFGTHRAITDLKFRLSKALCRH